MSGQPEDLKALLERQRASYIVQQKELRAELAKVEVAIRNLEAAIAAIQGFPEETALAGDSPRLTIKQAVMKILEPLAPRGLSALSILERLRVDFDMDYPRESLSPQLSRLKKEGKVILEGGIWYANTKQNGSGAEAPEPS